MSEVKNLENNKIIGEYTLDNTQIEFTGKNNILYLVGNIKLVNSKLRFTGNNSIIYLDNNKIPITINARVGNDSVLYLGKDTYINKGIDVYATERENIIIGDGCMLSYETTFRTTDPHLIYDINNKSRINFANSILVGDHVWIGQQCLILKNTKIYSGSIIGGHSVLSNKEVLSNTLWAGNPAKLIKKNVFFTRKSAHDFTKDDIILNKVYDKNDFIYGTNTDIDFITINEMLKSEESNVDNKICIINNYIANNKQKNRFSKI